MTTKLARVLRVSILRKFPARIRLALSLMALIFAWALAPIAAEAQMSPINLKFQSDNYQVLNRADTSTGFEITYLPKGEDATAWTHMLVIAKHGKKSMSEMAIAEASTVARRKGVDRYSGALLIQTKSKQSIFLDTIQSEDKYVECAMTRFFETKEGVFSYRLVRRMYRGRLPADASMANLEIMKFIDRSRTKRSDLIIDFARKQLPFQSPDDPMGMSQLPFSITPPKTAK